MAIRRSVLPLLLFSLLSAPLAASAAPGDFNAIEAHCGAPDTDTRSTSEVDNTPDRTLTYGKVRINFMRASGAPDTDWSYRSSWIGHLPATAHELGARMPCVGAALQDAAAQTQNTLTAQDPGIIAQSATAAPSHGMFGINLLWLILLLAGILAIFVVAVPRKKTLVHGPDPSVRPFRRPRLMLSKRRRPAHITGIPADRTPL